MFKGRSTVEIMVLCFTFIVTFSIVGLGILIVLVEWNNPEADTGVIASTLMSMITGILGALLGLIAGKSEKVDLHHKPTGEEDDLA